VNEQREQIAVSVELLALMRNAAAIAQRVREPFITVRALLLAMLDDPAIGPALSEAIPREKLEAFKPEGDMKRFVASRRHEPEMEAGERPSILRFDTLAFKTPDGSATVWLSREAFTVFCEGAQRSEEVYLPKHLAFGIAAEAVRTPGILAALQIQPGTVSEAVFGL
jgi:hypothetical protein